jgi:hypothetical protein
VIVEIRTKQVRFDHDDQGKKRRKSHSADWLDSASNNLMGAREILSVTSADGDNSSNNSSNNNKAIIAAAHGSAGWQVNDGRESRHQYWP